MKYLAILTLAAAAAFATPKVTYRVVNDCIPNTATRVPIVLPDGRVDNTGITCTVAPIIVADTVKADSAKGE